MLQNTEASSPLVSVLQVLGIVGGAVISAYKVLQLRKDSRSHLKTDLTILKSLDPTDPNYRVVKAHVDATITKLYSPPGTSRLKDLVADPFSLVLGIAMFIGFGIWSAYLFRNGFSWWGVLTAVFAASGITGIIEAFTRKKTPVIEEEKHSN